MSNKVSFRFSSLPFKGQTYSETRFRMTYFTFTRRVSRENLTQLTDSNIDNDNEHLWRNVASICGNEDRRLAELSEVICTISV